VQNSNGTDAPKRSGSAQKKQTVNSYLKYCGLAFQLMGAIGVFGWLGYKLDQRLSFTFPVFMLLFGFLAFGAMMVQLYRSLK
jgi:F0F1-type ATP synthase assembly protein I